MVRNKLVGGVAAKFPGLLAGFFRYFAYEFPMQSDVISIRHNPDEDNMPKMTFFEQLARKQALRQEEARPARARFVSDLQGGRGRCVELGRQSGSC